MASYKAVVDVTGTFADWELRLQKHVVPLLAQSCGGYHTEAMITVDNDNQVLVLWAAKGQDGVDWKFAITFTPLDASGNPSGAAKSWSTSGTTAFGKPAGVNGALDLSNLSGPKDGDK